MYGLTYSRFTLQIHSTCINQLLNVFFLNKNNGELPCYSFITSLAKGWMGDERCFRPLLCTVNAELGRGQPELMSWIWNETLGNRRLCFWPGLLVEFVCLSVCLWTLLKKLRMDCDEMLWRGLRWYNEELIKFWWWSGSSKMSKWEMDGWMNGVLGHFYALSRLNWAGDK